MINYISQISNIALLTVKEAVREKIFYNIFFFSLFLIFTSAILSMVTYGNPERVIINLSLSAISLSGNAIATFLTITLFHREIKNKTIYFVVSQSVSRFQFLLGKYAGILITLFFNTFAMFIAFLLTLLMMQVSFPQMIASAILMNYIEFMVISGFALFFISFSTPTLSSVFTIGIWIIGHLSKDLLYFSQVSKNLMLEKFSTLFYYVFPDLEKFNLKYHVIYSSQVSEEFLFFSIIYGLIFCFVLLNGAQIIFARRDLS